MRKTRLILPLLPCLSLVLSTVEVYAQEDDPGGTEPTGETPTNPDGDGAPTAPGASDGNERDEPSGEASQEDPAEDEYEALYEAEFGDEEGVAEATPVEELKSPPPAGKGVVWGVLRDSEYREPLFDATVAVVGTEHQAVTDIDGRFRLELPPGTYSLRFFAPMHRPTRLDGVTVVVGGVVEHSLVVEAEDMGEAIDVVAEAEKANLEGQTLARQRSASVGDSVGRHEISKAGDSTAAQAAQRVVGATVIGGRFVYVRGLGERYSNALFDGAPLPSPEPDRAAVPLDIFPADVLDSVNLIKTFTPDVPGDFAGGSVQVHTRAIPDEFVFGAGASIGFNTESTFRDRLHYSGSGTDWLGFDSSRGLPSGISRDYPRVAGEQPDGTVLTREQLAEEGKLLNSSFGFREGVFTPPDFGVNAVIGNGWKLAGDQKLGAIAALSYKRGWDTIEKTEREFRASVTDPRGYEPLFEYDVTQSTETVQWGAFGSLAYQLAAGHTLRLVTLRSQIADDEVELFRGRSEERSRYVTGSRLQFAARALSALKLSGEHVFKALDEGRLDWSGLYSVAERDEPDTRDIAFARQEDGELEFLNTSDSGRHFFAEQDERGIVGTLDWTQPLLPEDKAKLKFGSLASVKDREFNARRFNLSARPGQTARFSCAGPELDQGCVDSIFTDEALESGDLRMEERTQRSDGYTADLDVFAGYVMADIEVVPRFRAIVGERIEYTRQTIEPWSFGSGTDPGEASLSSTDLLPSLSLVYSATEHAKIRLAGSRTLARPQLRELAPFAFNDNFGGRSTVGNPDLTLTQITNADLRFEYFPTMREVAAVSLFYKHFEDPIELTLLDAGGSNPIRSFRNSPGAHLYGVELEVRKELAFVDDVLKFFTAVGNLTLARSRVEVEQTGFTTLTSLERPMVNQAPWVINLALDYDNTTSGTAARILYNVQGRQLVEVGTSGIPDAYLHPRHVVDLVASQRVSERVTVKVGVDNVLNAKYLVTQGKDREGNNVREEYTSGTAISVGAGYSL